MHVRPRAQPARLPAGRVWIVSQDGCAQARASFTILFSVTTTAVFADSDECGFTQSQNYEGHSRNKRTSIWLNSQRIFLTSSLFPSSQKKTQRQQQQETFAFSFWVSKQHAGLSSTMKRQREETDDQGQPVVSHHARSAPAAAPASAVPASGSSDGSDYFANGEGPRFLVFRPAASASAPPHNGSDPLPPGWTRRLRHLHATIPMALTDDVPWAAYRSRGREAKSAVHWGQRKLFLSELQLLALFARPGVKHWIVYVGAAPGSHLLFLDSLFSYCRHEWLLVDPGAFDNRVLAAAARPNARFAVHNAYCNNALAYALVARRLQRSACPALSALYSHLTGADAFLSSTAATSAAPSLAVRETDGTDAEHARTDAIPTMYEPPVALPVGLGLLFRAAAARTPMLFVSDVRSGREDFGNFEDHVRENSRAQECWAGIIGATFAMLKFRLPYSFTSRYSSELGRQVVAPATGPPETAHPGGVVLLPVWTRPTSTETRLVIPAGLGAAPRLYHHGEYENRMFFFNAVMRERVHFGHFLGDRPSGGLDHRYDGAAEVALLRLCVRLRRRYESGGPNVNGSSDGSENSDDDGGVDDNDAALASEVAALAMSVTSAIGGSFERAVAHRDQVAVDKAHRAGWVAATDAKLAAAARARRLAVWWRSAASGGGAVEERPHAWRLFPFRNQNQTAEAPASVIGTFGA